MGEDGRVGGVDGEVVDGGDGFEVAGGEVDGEGVVVLFGGEGGADEESEGESEEEGEGRRKVEVHSGGSVKMTWYFRFERESYTRDEEEGLIDG